MIKIENIQTSGWEMAIKGMRNPKSTPGGINNSWDKADSHWVAKDEINSPSNFIYKLGQNDLDLACRLIKAGPEHAKFLRMIHVQMDITAPLFWITEHDTYKVATTRNSCSKMHRIHIKSFELNDFSYEGCSEIPYAIATLSTTVATCEQLRQDYNETKDKKYWRALIELLPENYNMTFTWDGSLQTILSILKQRKGHKLDEWEEFRQTCFNNIPYCKEFYDAYVGG